MDHQTTFLSGDVVRAELAKILSSNHFRAAETISTFLNHIVMCSLAGEQDRLKEYALGLEVFGRKTSYDPQLDPVVRQTARRLRAKLEAYYSSEGAQDEIRIEIPKGGYSAVFSVNHGPLGPNRAVAEDKTDKLSTFKAYRKVLIAVCGLVFIALAFWLRASHMGRRRLADQSTIVLSDFSNTTGDPVFDDTLKTALTISLQESPFLNVLADSKVTSTIRQMTRAENTRVTPEVARELCQRTGSNAYIAGAIDTLDTRYVITLKAVNCQTGDTISEQQITAESKRNVLEALGKATSRVRRELGESRASLRKYATPLEEATTPSLEALKAYTLGWKIQQEKGQAAALPYYQRALDLDPQFAMADRSISITYGNLNEIGLAGEYARKAYNLREKVSERERLAIEANYFLQGTGELDKAAQAYELLQQIYPKDFLPYLNLSYVYCLLGRAEKSLAEAQQALQLEPSNLVNYLNLGQAYANLNRFDDAAGVYQRADARVVNADLLLLYRYQLAFLQGDTNQMSRLVDEATGKAGIEDALVAAESDTAACYGKWEEARELTSRAANLAMRNNAKETAAEYQVEAALREAALGDTQQAASDAKRALTLASNRDIRSMAALVEAMAGQRASAEQLETQLDAAFPLDTIVQKYWLPTIRAASALRSGDPAGAVEQLNAAKPIEYGQPAQVVAFLCPAYLRGEAYLALHDPTEAAEEFQKFVDRRGLVVNFPWGALARLGLARAYAQKQDMPKARTTYVEFLTLWKNADSHLPLLRHAKAEYTTLQ